MRDLTPLIPGFYTDGEGSIYVNIREFMTIHGLHDSPEARNLVWAEIREAFGDVPIVEISD
jgi:hypothetical protein